MLGFLQSTAPPAFPLFLTFGHVRVEESNIPVYPSLGGLYNPNPYIEALACNGTVLEGGPSSEKMVLGDVP